MAFKIFLGYKRPLVRSVCNVFLSENPFSAHGRKFRMGFFCCFQLFLFVFYAQGLSPSRVLNWSDYFFPFLWLILMKNYCSSLPVLWKKLKRWNQCPCFVVVAYLWMIYFFGNDPNCIASILNPLSFPFYFSLQYNVEEAAWILV